MHFADTPLLIPREKRRHSPEHADNVPPVVFVAQGSYLADAVLRSLFHASIPRVGKEGKSPLACMSPRLEEKSLPGHQT